MKKGMRAAGTAITPNSCPTAPTLLLLRPIKKKLMHLGKNTRAESDFVLVIQPVQCFPYSVFYLFWRMQILMDLTG